MQLLGKLSDVLSAESEDRDDNDPNINIDMIGICDGKDNNCDYLNIGKHDVEINLKPMLIQVEIRKLFSIYLNLMNFQVS